MLLIVGCGDNSGYWLLPDFGHQSGDIPNMMRGIVVYGALRWQVRWVGLELEAICRHSPQSELLALGEGGHESRETGINVREVLLPSREHGGASWKAVELNRLLLIQTRPDHFQGSFIRPVLMPSSPSQGEGWQAWKDPYARVGSPAVSILFKCPSSSPLKWRGVRRKPCLIGAACPVSIEWETAVKSPRSKSDFANTSWYVDNSCSSFPTCSSLRPLLDSSGKGRSRIWTGPANLALEDWFLPAILRCRFPIIDGRGDREWNKSSDITVTSAAVSTMASTDRSPTKILTVNAAHDSCSCFSLLLEQESSHTVLPTGFTARTGVGGSNPFHGIDSLSTNKLAVCGGSRPFQGIASSCFCELDGLTIFGGSSPFHWLFSLWISGLAPGFSSVSFTTATPWHSSWAKIMPSWAPLCSWVDAGASVPTHTRFLAPRNEPVSCLRDIGRQNGPAYHIHGI